jgi:hypothetical protein
VREWRDDDVQRIIGLLTDSPSGFDPEGPLEIDCGSPAAIQESYNRKDGGCFLVATDDRNDDDDDDDDSDIMGTAALTVGTQIAYLKSGASISSPVVTGAVRRVCTIAHAPPATQELILQTLLEEIETRAVQHGATELIVLAYPTTRRPNHVLLDKRGYRKVLPSNLDGVVQYCRSLGDKESDSSSRAAATTTISNDASSNIVIGTSFVVMLLLVFSFVGNLMGLELMPSNDNRGIGTPLSIQEVQRLKQDEQLKRMDLDGKGIERQWEDLGMEERREEAALMKIIQGQDIRLQ